MNLKYKCKEDNKINDYDFIYIAVLIWYNLDKEINYGWIKNYK